MVLQGRMGKISMGELMNETLQMTKYLLFLSLLLIGCSKEPVLTDQDSKRYTVDPQTKGLRNPDGTYYQLVD